MESWGDLARQLWWEMNPIEGYTSPEANRTTNINTYKNSGVYPSKGVVYPNNVNKFTNINGTKLRLPFLTKASIPGNSQLMPGPLSYLDGYVVDESDIKYIKNNLDAIKNRIPTNTLNKMAKKIQVEKLLTPSLKSINMPATMVAEMVYDEYRRNRDRERDILRLKQQREVEQKLKSMPMYIEGKYPELDLRPFINP